MKIAQVAPLYESVPPKYYGGTERIVSYLTETLVGMGHDVTLYASADSQTSAKLKPGCHRAIRLDKKSIDPVADHVLLTEIVCQDAAHYDIIHSHIDYLAYPLYRRIKTPHVTTLHGRLDIPNLYNLYREFDDIPLVSISNSQRLPLSWAHWVATVYHGLPENLYTFQEKPGKYLAYIGRISPEKRVDKAIEIAKKVGMPLKIAAKVDKVDQEYFDVYIKPLLDHRDIDYIGEIGDAEKDDFFGNAYAFLFPIDWPEPFGLVMIEAMACGTPTIAYLQGSVPEVMQEGVTGFIVKDLESALAAVKKVSQVSRRKCRQVFEDRFTARRMAEDYLRTYQALINGRSLPEKEPLAS
ncbi:MAG: glycosyltransferase family 4 protein [Candidatus Omnitrophica bacterium]|nr:glycosyltransferase family 4 protein [Candidatus Omnitrophota bacterium]